MEIRLPQIKPEDLTDLESAKRLVVELMNCFEQVMEYNHQLLKENQQLRKRIAKLENRPGPPSLQSTDYSSKKGLKQAVRSSKKWRKSSKKDKIEIDQEVRLPELRVCSCGSNHFQVLRSRQKVTQGILIKRNNTRWTGDDKQCVECGEVYPMVIPDTIKHYEFDAQTRTWVSILKHEYRFTEPLLHRLFTSLGINISKGQITNIRLRNSDKLIRGNTHLSNWGIKKARYLQTDATGSKRKSSVTGKIAKQHLHFVGNHRFSLFKITSRYNTDIMAHKVLGKRGRGKILISDDHSANGNKLPIRDKQLCWIHEIRHYHKLTPQLRAHQIEVDQVIDQLWQFYQRAKEYGRDPTETKKQRLEALFDQITNHEVNYEQLTKRLKLTKKKRQRLLTFLQHPAIPLHNNLAERDLREAVIQRKISHETKSKAGDKSLVRHLSIIQTIRKQNLNLFDTLHGLLNDQISPFVLTKNFA